MKKITCVIENSVKQGTPFWGEHGLSFRIEVDDACALFDTGNSEAVLLHNLGLLGRCPRNASAVILSHAHHDHTGGLPAVLSQKPGLPLYANPDIFRPRYSLRDGEYKDIGSPINREALTQLADLRLSDTPVEVLPGLWTSGEIKERPEPEGRGARHFVPADDGWQPDPYQDDMAMVLETEDGLALICGCCHAGLLNTLAHVRRIFQRPIIAVLGGAHLIAADETQLQHIINVLRDVYQIPRLYLNHCTGIQAQIALTNAFGERAQPFPAGAELIFE